MKGNAIDWLALFVSPLDHNAELLFVIVDKKDKVLVANT
jgi:hypothetical protein